MAKKDKQKKKPVVLIAVVDDHVYSATFIAQELENKGFKTIQAYNGPDAIKLCKEHKPDLILLDVMLTGIDGFGVASQLKEHKIIFMTGEDELIEKAKKVKNSVGVIKKPVDIAELLEIIAKYFDIPKHAF